MVALGALRRLILTAASGLLFAVKPCTADFAGSAPMVGRGEAPAPAAAASQQPTTGRFLAPRAASPPRPFPPLPSFSATVTEHPQAFVQFSGAQVSSRYHNLTFAYDADRQVSEFTFLQTGFWFLGPEYAMTPNQEFWTPDGGSLVANNGAICIPVSGRADMRTSALRYLWEELLKGNGSFVGDAQVGGQPCDQWRVSDARWGNMSMCVGADGVPREVVVEASAEVFGISNVCVCSHNVTFHNIRLGEASGASAVQPAVCPQQVHKACEGTGTAALQALRFSNGEPWGHIEDRDLFDWTAFPITASEFAGSHKYLELFDVDANSSYGPWRECDYVKKTHEDHCSELEADVASLVSRVSAEMLMGSAEDPLGQCGANEVSGSWLVFPHQGECGEGQAIGDQGCTWKVKDWKVVTVESVFALLKSEFSLDLTNKTAVRDVLTEESPPFPGFLRMVKAAVMMSPAVDKMA